MKAFYSDSSSFSSATLRPIYHDDDDLESTLQIDLSQDLDSELCHALKNQATKFKRNSLVIDFDNLLSHSAEKDEYWTPKMDPDVLDCIYESLSFANIEHLTLKEH